MSNKKQLTRTKQQMKKLTGAAKGCVSHLSFFALNNFLISLKESLFSQKVIEESVLLFSKGFEPISTELLLLLTGS